MIDRFVDQEAGLQIRVRVDGVLQTQTEADKRIGAALAQRLKLMAGPPAPPR